MEPDGRNEEISDSGGRRLWWEEKGERERGRKVMNGIKIEMRDKKAKDVGV